MTIIISTIDKNH